MTTKENNKPSIIQLFLAVLIAAYMIIFRRTSRLEVIGLSNPQKFWDKKQPVILALWHGRLMYSTYISPKKVPITALASMHKDGKIIALAVNMIGMDIVEGSSTRGGVSAVRQLLKASQKGNSIFITPDAPPNKVYTCAKGVAEIARIGKLPVIPCAFSVKHGKQLNTKDRFILPRPFTKLYLQYGKPIMPDEDENLLEKIETALINLTKKVDKRAQHEDWS